MPACPRCAPPPATVPCCGPCTFFRKTAAGRSRPRRSKRATSTASSRSRTSPAGRRGSICRTSSRPGRPGIRRWPSRWRLPRGCCAAAAPAASTAAASRAPRRPLCRWTCWRASGRATRPSWARDVATCSPSAARAACCCATMGRLKDGKR